MDKVTESLKPRKTVQILPLKKMSGAKVHRMTLPAISSLDNQNPKRFATPNNHDRNQLILNFERIMEKESESQRKISDCSTKATSPNMASRPSKSKFSGKPIIVLKPKSKRPVYKVKSTKVQKGVHIAIPMLSNVSNLLEPKSALTPDPSRYSKGRLVQNESKQILKCKLLSKNFVGYCSLLHM